MQDRRRVFCSLVGLGLAGVVLPGCSQLAPSAPARHAATLPEKPIVSEDILTIAAPPADQRIAYGADPQQFGDLYLPNGAGPHPLVILVHGGYWRARYDLGYFGHCAAALANQGFVVWNIEYRRVGNPGGAWPGTFVDVAAASDYCRTLAAQYPIDLKRIAVVGHSAGGHLALWLAGRSRIPAESPIAAADPLLIALVVALAPVADLRLAWELGLSNAAAAELIGGSPDQYPDRYAAASPAELLPLGTRQVVVHGREDSAVPFAVAEHYVAVAQATGDSVELVVPPATGHFEIVDPRTPQWQQIATYVAGV